MLHHHFPVGLLSVFSHVSSHFIFVHIFLLMLIIFVVINLFFIGSYALFTICLACNRSVSPKTRYQCRGLPKLPTSHLSIGLYRDVWIAAIASSTTSLATRTAAICVRCQGRRVRRVYVTMQITFLTRKSALIYRRGLRQRVASLTLNCNGVFAIRAYCNVMIPVGA